VNNCQHNDTKTGTPYCYMGSVAEYPYTHENRAAHGSVTYRETCRACGARRQVNHNGVHRECSTWSMSAHDRQRHHADLVRAAIASINREMAAHGIEIDRLVRLPGYSSLTAWWSARVVLDGEARTYDRDQIVASESWSENTAEQRAVMRRLRECLDRHALTLSVEGDV